MPSLSPQKGPEQMFARFLRRTLASYFTTSRPSKEAIDRAFGKLHDKARAVSKPFQLEIIGDMSKGVFNHVHEESEYKDYAWRKHIELDKEIRRQHEHFQTKLKKGLRGEFSTNRIGVSGGVETTREPVANNATNHSEEPML